MRLVRELAAGDLDRNSWVRSSALADDELLVLTRGAATTTSSFTTLSTVLANRR